MGRQLLTMLGPDPEATEAAKVPLTDGALRALYETLVLTRVLDRACTDLQASGSLGFHVPALPAAATSAGAAAALHDGDFLFPSFRDLAAFLYRGGTIDAAVQQLLSGAGDSLGGRQLPGHFSLPEGRFVAVSGLVGAQVQQAAGAALGLRLRGDAGIALALFGPAAAQQGAFFTGLGAARRHRAPVVFVCRTGGDERPSLAGQAEGLGLHADIVDGGDCLAVAKAVASGRRRAQAGEGPTFVEAVVPVGEEAEDFDPARLLRGFVEHRGLWDAEREEEFTRRCGDRIQAALDALEPAGAPAAAMFEQVWQQPTWTLREQAAARGIEIEGGDD